MKLYNLITEHKDLKEPRKGYIWCTDGSFVKPEEFSTSGKTAYGYALTNKFVVSIRKSSKSMGWYDSSRYCMNESIAGKRGRVPSLDDLKSIIDSIMDGRMKDDLLTAGIYELCNYRIADDCTDGWNYIWSRDIYDSYPSYLNRGFYVLSYYKGSLVTQFTLPRYALPVFKF